MPVDPLISICIPTFNGEKYLRECIDSCLNQTFKDFEVVISDDCSQDKTLQIIEEYAITETRIRLFKSENNSGLVENWNNCIKNSRGKWIKFVFQDDFITADCLEKFVSAIDPGAMLIVSKRNFLLPDDISEPSTRYYTQDVKTLENTGHYIKDSFTPKLISTIAVENICLNFIGEPSLIFFRKKIVDELGYFTNTLKQICDLEFVLRISTKYGLNYIPETICAFRVHGNSATQLNIKNKFFELRYIEPIIFTWFLLYDPKFKNFRHQLDFFQNLKLKIYFRVKVYDANRINLTEGRNHQLFNENYQEFKEIRMNKNGNIFIKLVSIIKKKNYEH